LIPSILAEVTSPVNEIQPKIYAILCTCADATQYRMDSRASNIKGDPRKSKYLMDEAEAAELASKFNESALPGVTFKVDRILDREPAPLPTIDYTDHEFVGQRGHEKKFCVSKVTPSLRFGKKFDKKPLLPKDFTAANFMTAEQVIQRIAVMGPGHYLGYYIEEGSQTAYKDIDACRNEETQELTLVARETLADYPGAYVGVSISGTGLQIVTSYTGECPEHGCRNDAKGLELYTKGKIITIGFSGVGRTDADCTAGLLRQIALNFPETAAGSADAENWTEGPCKGANPIKDDSELIDRARKSTSGNAEFGSVASFEALWSGEEAELAEAFPSSDEMYNASSADMALATHFSWWTGNDCQRIENLMRQSALERPKWDEMRGSITWLQMTILKAVSMQHSWFGQNNNPEPGTVVTPDGNYGVETPQKRKGNGFMTIDDQLQYFAGCTYIESMNAALVPDGSILKPEAFTVRYGGYQFNMDDSNHTVSKKPWEAWTQNQVYSCVKAYSTCFKPQLPFGTIVTRDGQRFANTYRSITIDRKQGDVSPFLNHIAKLLPDERDRTIMLSYMAAVVQHQGTKFMWAPLLQGVQGNGKSLLSKCVEQAVGARYTYWPKATELGEKFNAWMKDKVLYAVEDVYVPDSRVEIMEALKPMITGQSLKVEKKGVDQEMADICGNFIFNSNHKEALRVNNDERRYCIFITPQQVKEDLERDGMDGRYFPKLVAWLYKEDGFAIVSEFLHTYAIPAELNPAGDCQRAPVSTTFHEAVAASQGGIEQDLEAALEEGAQGFRGGWVSSTWFEQLPRVLKSNLTRNKRHEILARMGYILHPALKNGWTDHIVVPDSKKAKLYIKRTDTMLAQLKGVAAAKHYEDSNKLTAPVDLPFGQHTVTSINVPRPS
jgi:hypothetical protein